MYISRWPALSYWVTGLAVTKAMWLPSGETCILVIGVSLQASIGDSRQRLGKQKGPVVKVVTY